MFPDSGISSASQRPEAASGSCVDKGGRNGRSAAGAPSHPLGGGGTYSLYRGVHSGMELPEMSAAGNLCL